MNLQTSLQTTSVFEKNLTAYTDNESLIINQGGTRSSKTYSILQLLFIIAFYSKQKKVISVVSRALPHLKLGAIRDFDNILLSAGIIPDKVKNKTDNIYYINNSIIEFFGADQADKVHGPARDILFVNEANFIKQDIYNQLEVRTTGCIFIDYNPTQRFWVHDQLMPNSKHVFIKSTYLNNEFLTAKQIERIEAKKKNENWWRVYGEGEVGMLEGAIFANWKYGEFDSSLPYAFGLDYGFFPDPDALIKCAISHKANKIYWHECIYENNNGTSELIEQMKNYCTQNSMIIAESASPRTNYDLKKYFTGLRPVQKTKTVSDWLRDMQNYEIIITPESYNLEKELQNYIWNDKKAGVPIDDFNHLIDAGRYHFMANSRVIKRGIKSSL